MNKYTVFASAFLAAASMNSFASPALYTFNAPIFASEVNNDSTDIFDATATIAGTFWYDADTPATAINQTSVDLGTTGPYSFYNGSIQNLSAVVAGQGFSATTGGTYIGDASGFSGLDAVFNRAGQNGSDIVGTGFSGFTLGNYHLIGFDLYSYSLATTFASQALPSPLSNGDVVTAVNLVFADGDNNQRLVQFGIADIQLAEVPLPAGAWLFGSAALVLFGRSRKRA